MSVILQPQKDYPIVRQISNHLDTDVYYVQAVVRDADGNTIATVNLDSKGGQRYQKRYRVPVDASGQGTYISIVTSVYTDSGYTTKSSNYGDEETTYLIFDRVMPSMRGAGGGGLDARTVRRIVSEELEKAIPEEPEEPEEPEVEEPEELPRWDEVLKAISDQAESIRAIVAKIPTEIDVSPVLASLDEVKRLVIEKEVTPETELAPVYEELDALAESVNQELLSHRVFLQGMKTDLTSTITETVKDSVDNTEFVATDFKVKPQKKEKVETEAEVPQVDLSKLV